MFVISGSLSNFRPHDPDEDFNELVTFVMRTCERKAQTDYGNCTLVVAIDSQPYFAVFGTRFEEQVQSVIGKLQQIKFKARRVFLLILPDRVEAIDG